MPGHRDQILLMYREYRHLPDEAHRRYRDREREREREREILDLFAGLITTGVKRGQCQPVNAVVIAQDIVLLGHLPALKSWSVAGTVEPEVLDGEQIELILDRLCPEGGSGSASGAHRGDR